MKRHVLVTSLLSAGAFACTTESTTSGAPTTSALGSAALAADVPADLDASRIVARWKGGELSYGEAHGDVSSRLLQAEIEFLQTRYQTQLEAVEGRALQALVTAEAAARGLEEAALFAAEIDAKVSGPTEQEVQEMYPALRRQLNGESLEEARPKVEQFILQRKKTERLQAYITELRDKYELEVDLPYPEIPRIPMGTDGNPSFGPDDAPITIVEFGDYECGYCGRAFATVQQIQEAFPTQVRVVYRDFPLDFHARAIPAAVAANCAGEQDKYWEAHNVLMQNQRALQDDELRKHISSVGVDMATWEACFTNSKPQEEEIQRDYAAGQAAGVTGTPAFFVNGIFLSGALPFEQFEEIIQRELGS